MTAQDFALRDYALADGKPKRISWYDYNEGDGGFGITKYEGLPLSDEFFAHNNLEYGRNVFEYREPVKGWRDDTVITIDKRGYLINPDESMYVWCVSVVNKECKIDEGGHAHVKIRFVHEFQRVLRAVGMTEYANNLVL